MKKLVAAAAVACVLALAGCGSSGAASSDAPQEPSSGGSASASASAEPSPSEAAEKSLKEAIGDVQTTFYDEVRNDKTGNWRCFVYYSSAQPQEIAADYYKAYFGDDSEVHALVNLGLKTSANMTVTNGTAFVDVYEYVQGEEHDAEKMFTGAKLASYQVDLKTGSVEEV